ncbi:MAG: hypothetical protein IT162_15720 [Bryobacterales bacterium]|nr:hypothetical protein [Bryobacterales bacterium]
MSAALLIGFGSLLFLIGILGFGAMRRTSEMHEQMIAARVAYEETDKAVRDLPAHIHLAGILVRDYVLDPSPSVAPLYREQLAKELQAIEGQLARLGRLSTAPNETVARLQKEAQAYADSLDPMLTWSAEEKVARSYAFIRDNLIRRRESIVSLTQEIAALNAQNLAMAREARERSQADLQQFVRDLLGICLGLGLLVALVSTWRVAALERRTQKERERAEEAEREQRRLAARLVQTQEEERKHIALELHDAVGQMASAVGMELGRLEAAHLQPGAQFHEALAEAKRMNTDVVRAIKDLAGGLRPAMLDDLGLGPALRAHAREASRRTGMPVDVRLDGEIESVPEPHRTCIYRIVQEALNNCGRHAGAKQAIVSLYGSAELVSVTIQDDGVGFDPERRPRAGLGLVGMQERARDLGGKVRITSKPGHGTLVEVELPVRRTVNV